MWRGKLYGLVVLLGLLATLFAGASTAFAAGDANMANCSNETLSGFETYLPDCRAYEMVSPLFKDGRQLTMDAVTADGSHVLAKSFAALAETEGDGNEEALYELARSSDGWQVAALTPPASQFPVQLFEAASPDLEKSLWIMRTPAQSIYAEDLYVREADGSFVKVGPLVPPSAEIGPPVGSYEAPYYRASIKYADASSDLSHVVFEFANGAPRWPGDTTSESRSLYEYVRGASRPELVGVDAAGQLISDCETDVGSENSADLYNAISAAGSVVFFTAVGHSAHGSVPCPTEVAAPEVTELYARFSGQETVPISEPQASACAACAVLASASEGRKEAQFAGASEDGSKVFFLTEQALLGGASTMNLYEYDFDAPSGAKVMRASAGTEPAEVQGVVRVSEDGSHVYFVAKGALTAGPNAEGREPVKGEDNLYVFERDSAYPAGRLSFIATLSENDSEDWRSRDSRPVSATPNGRYIVFESVADLTAGDDSSLPQVFEYDAQTGELARVSVGRPGYTGEADANGATIPYTEYLTKASPQHTGTAISSDGSTVIFATTGALTGEAVAAHDANVESVYEYHSDGTIRDGGVYLISDGASMLPNSIRGMDTQGTDAFFETPASLLHNETDTSFQLYDARVDGGFAGPSASAVCESEGCLGPLPPIPSSEVSPSTLTSGASEAVPASPPSLGSPTQSPGPKRAGCVPPKRLLHGKCVKAKQKKRRKRRGTEAKPKQRHAKSERGRQ